MHKIKTTKFSWYTRGFITAWLAAYTTALLEKNNITGISHWLTIMLFFSGIATMAAGALIDAGIMDDLAKAWLKKRRKRREDE